jgi:hypothetical protein
MDPDKSTLLRRLVNLPSQPNHPMVQHVGYVSYSLHDQKEWDEPSEPEVSTMLHQHMVLEIQEVELHQQDTPHNCSFLKPKHIMELNKLSFRQGFCKDINNLFIGLTTNKSDNLLFNQLSQVVNM